MLLGKWHLTLVAQGQKQKLYILSIFVILKSGITLELWINMQDIWGIVESNIAFHS